jgi:anti-sigma regulatory factor (Ser/Thr protein kinase)
MTDPRTAERADPVEPAGVSRRVFAGEIPELRELSRWARDLCAAAGVAEEVALDLEVCLNELAANVMLHGRDQAGPRSFSVALETAADGVRAVIEDAGPPFDPTQVPERPAAASLEALTFGGYGLPIVRGLARNLRYARDGDTNVLAFEVGGRP